MRTRHGFTLIELPVVRKRERRAFTLIELLIVIGILAVLVTILVPVIGNVMEKARVGKCMGNLKHISGAIANNLPDNSGNRIFGMVHAKDTAATFAEVNTDPLLPAIGSNDVNALSRNAMQNVWKMVADYQVTPTAFLCPSDSTEPRAGATTLKYGWTRLTEFSYGIQYPYGDYSINDTRLMDRTVIMADRNPGGAVNGGSMRHSNHEDGVVVLFYDGNIKFHEAADSQTGYGRDEIYTNSALVPGGAPTHAGDTSITPCPSRS